MTIITAAQGARSQLLMKKQSALGTVATGNFTRFRFSTHSLDVVKGTFESDEIRPDREVEDYRHGNQNAAGDIVFNLCYGDHDTILESAMFDVFTTDQLSIGVAPQWLSIEDGALDISQYRMFEDMAVNTLTLAMGPQQQIVRCTANLIGSTGQANTGSTQGGTAVSPSSNQPFDSFNGAIFDNAAETGNELAIVTGFEFTINNGLEPGFGIGQQTPVVMEYGKGRVSGRLTAYYTDADLINRFVSEEEAVLVVNLTDPHSNSYEFRFPRIKYNGANVPVSGEKSRIITIPFMALYDSTVGSAFKITRAS